MSKCYLTTSIKVPLGSDALPTERICRHLGLSQNAVSKVALHKQSLDARDKSDVHFVCSYLVWSETPPRRNAKPFLPPQDVLKGPQKAPCGKSCIVVGAGPSGLFLARYLSHNGFKVTVVERGSDVEIRRKKVQAFFDSGVLDENCNVQFGLGGAGTFSDGKLTTGTSSPLTATVFNEFVRCGAPKQILSDSLPHIGTDNLVKVVANLRNEIVRSGGQFLFDVQVTDVLEKNGRAVGVEAFDGTHTMHLYADCVALCCGHSAKNLFHALVKHNVSMQAKPFAVGVRIEHPREFINKAQFGETFATHRDLGAASYKLTHNVDGRGCYSFCMCPGGVVVPSSCEQETVVVNGMSNFARDAQNSNSALVVSVSPTDVVNYGFGDRPLSGLRFQESLEKRAFQLGGGGFKAPYQTVCDFAGRKPAKLTTAPSYLLGVSPCKMDDLLPSDVCAVLRQSLEVFNGKIRGFAECGVLTGVETRTSSPVKILRDQTMQSSLLGLYPVGEGAGHAGGIVTAAVDGLKVAMAICQNAD